MVVQVRAVVQRQVPAAGLVSVHWQAAQLAQFQLSVVSAVHCMAVILHHNPPTQLTMQLAMVRLHLAAPPQVLLLVHCSAVLAQSQVP